MTPEELLGTRTTPAPPEDSLRALDGDRAFLTDGGVFTDDLTDTWIDSKTEHEIDPLRMRAHPYEFYLSYDN